MRGALALTLASATLLAGCHARTATPPAKNPGVEVMNLGDESPGSPWRAYTFGNCVREGWTSNVGGKIVTCKCRIGDCEQNGADCSTD